MKENELEDVKPYGFIIKRKKSKKPDIYYSIDDITNDFTIGEVILSKEILKSSIKILDNEGKERYRGLSTTRYFWILYEENKEIGRLERIEKGEIGDFEIKIMNNSFLGDIITEDIIKIKNELSMKVLTSVKLSKPNFKMAIEVFQDIDPLLANLIAIIIDFIL